MVIVLHERGDKEVANVEDKGEDYDDGQCNSGSAATEPAPSFQRELNDKEPLDAHPHRDPCRSACQAEHQVGLDVSEDETKPIILHQHDR